MSIDPFTPWQQDPVELGDRTVGRDDELRWLTSSCEAWLRGDRPPWCLVIGPRGSGKSHLLQVARSRLSAPSAVIWVAEDTATSSDVDTLWASIWTPEDPWGWTPDVPKAERPILFVEGFDRLLAALRPEGRWALRHHLQECGAFLVATALDASFAAGDGEPFFGQLDTWSLPPLDLDQRRTLWLSVSGESLHDPVPQTLTRREALIRLTGGSPRAVVTLADAARGTRGDDVGAADALLRAVQRLVTHYQQRFQDLPPLGQQMVQALARAPRQLTGTEIQNLTRGSSAAVSNAARALEQAGVLTRHPDPDDARVSRYALTEPLFRYWLEYRTLPSWSATRAAWFGRLLGEVLTREEITNVWWSSPDPDIRRAAAGASEPHALWWRGQEELWKCAASDIPAVVARIVELDLYSSYAVIAMHALVVRREAMPFAELAPWGERHSDVRALLDLCKWLPVEGRAAFARFIDVVAASKRPESLMAWVAGALLDREADNVAHWEPLTPSEQVVFSKIPYFRVMFAQRGWTTAQSPLLSWDQVSRAADASDADVEDVFAAAHEHRDIATFVRCSHGVGWLPDCPRPEVVAPEPRALVECMERSSSRGRWLTWAASFADLDDADFDRVLNACRPRVGFWDPPGETSALTALVALGLRAPDRLERLLEVLGDLPIGKRAALFVRQLAERERGELHPELEQVWQAITRHGST